MCNPLFYLTFKKRMNEGPIFGIYHLLYFITRPMEIFIILTDFKSETRYNAFVCQKDSPIGTRQ